MSADPSMFPSRRPRPGVLLPACLVALVCFGIPAPRAGAAATARSALVALEATAQPADVRLRLLHAGDAAGGGGPLAVSALAVTLDGRPAPATLEGDGSWSIAWPQGMDATQPHRLDVTVTHDGIRELLEAQLGENAPAPSPIGGRLLGEHKQIAWWILNIGVVLIAALALSRRRG